MEPTINHDSLIVTRPFLPKFESLSKNDVIIAQDPEQEEKTILKRITHLAGEKGKNSKPIETYKTHKIFMNL